jgi:hypothetical protein
MKKTLISKLLLTLTLALPLLFTGCAKKIERPHILLITIDTLRRDHLGFYGYYKNTSPFIDQLARKGLVFKNTVTPLPLTDPSHTSILTGRHPLVHGIQDNAMKLSPKFDSLAQIFQKNGYYTMAAVSVFHLCRKYGFKKGFDSFSDDWDYKKKHNKTWFRIAKYTNESSFKMIDKYLAQSKDKPLFMWVHYYDPHNPYVDWDHIQLDGVKKNEPRGVTSYDKEIRYTDDAIKELLAYLEAKGLSKDMVTCITADHGEHLGDHGIFGKHSDIYSENSFVPLILHGSPIHGEKIIDDYVSVMDIAPTLLGLANLAFEKPVNGFNLLNPDREPVLPLSKDRRFLVTGSLSFVRSPQWVQQPYSFILNFDHIYKHLYVTQTGGFPEDRLKPVPKEALNVKFFEKSQKYRVTVDYPERLYRGAQVAVLRFDLKANHGLTVGYNIGTRAYPRMVFKEKPAQTITAFFPFSPLDSVQAEMFKREKTIMDNLRYTVIPYTDFLALENPGQPYPNKIFKGLGTQRKHRTGNELFNLGNDPLSRKNLLNNPNTPTPPQVITAKKAIYDLIKRYTKERLNFSKKSGRRKPLTEKEKEMLKSLGYL